MLNAYQRLAQDSINFQMRAHTAEAALEAALTRITDMEAQENHPSGGGRQRMSTDAQFKKGQLVWFSNANSEDELGAVTEVTQKNPAQYHVYLFGSGKTEVCGEGKDEPGAVSAL